MQNQKSHSRNFIPWLFHPVRTSHDVVRQRFTYDNEETDVPEQEEKLVQQLTQWIDEHRDARPTENDEDEYDDDFETNA